MLGIPTTAAASLLQEHKWNTQRVKERFLENTDRAMKKASVTSRCSPVEGATITTLVGGEPTIECLICLDPMTEADSMRMPCGHHFCLDCWTEFLTNVIDLEGANCMVVTCPDATCLERITEDEVQAHPSYLPNTDSTRSTALPKLLECGVRGQVVTESV